MLRGLKKSIYERIKTIQKDKKIKRYNKVMIDLEKKDISLSEKEKIKEYFKRYNIEVNNFKAYAFFKNCYTFDKRYIPESLMYLYIEPFLNNKKMSIAYEDKSTLEKFNNLIKVPKIFYKNIHGRYYNHEDNLIDKKEIKLKDGEYIIKPSIDTNQGSGVELLQVKNPNYKLKDKYLSFKEIEKIYEKNFLIQEKISQKGNNFNKIYSGSVNTLRVMTFRKDKEILILSVVARFGNIGCIADNPGRSGGIAVGVDIDKGVLKKEAFLARKIKVDRHPSTKVKVGGVKIENFDKVKEIVILLHKELKYFDLISWDIAINENEEVCLIEMNTNFQEIIFHQTANGPLFGKHTDYILENISKKYGGIKI